MWDLVRGAAQLKQPTPAELGRRYAEMLTENLGQPGFRELLVTVHDVDAHRDLLFALVGEDRRRDLIRRPTSDAAEARRAEVFDLAGVARDHLPDAVAGGADDSAGDRVAPRAPSRADAYWRGETHRLCDRPAGLIRLIDELIDLGVEQIVLVSAAPESPGPHALRRAAARRPRPARRVPAVGRGRRRPRRDDDDRRRAGIFTDSAGAQSDRAVRFRRRLRRSIASASGAGRADEPRLRRRVPPVHRAGRRRQGTSRSARVGRAQSRSETLEIDEGSSDGADSCRAKRDRGAPAPLTTPIYETTTFVFENAQEVVAYNEGRSTKYLYSRYTNPTVVSGGAEAGGARSRRGGAAVLVRAWARRRRS